MNTNSYARVVVTIKAIVICLAIIGIAGFMFCASETLASQLGQITAPCTECPQPPPMDLVALFAAAS
jgi:hypothetical protein